ncbi:hypothetical protein WME90_32810 [Sorangium sp. So ce375]|uniref:hypothetical protein n=1 Tax=Sorangium sp. So ce375 TaxID=3133306 RepID=UPI003F5CA39E
MDTASPSSTHPSHGDVDGSEVGVITFNAVPPKNPTFKYEKLGVMALENRRQYCARHGYRFIDDVPVAADRPACWAKLPAILDAFERHRWVLWADSDTLVFNQARRVEEFCDPAYDLIVQSHDEYLRFLGVPLAEGLARMPINTGVFLMQATAWSRDFLREAYAQVQFVSQGEIWDGIGEQEAMIWLLKQHPEDLRRIKYVDGLQNHPRFYRSSDLFVHFHGNFARHRIPLSECDEVFRRWEEANQRGEPLPTDLARFHWCCIQNKDPDGPITRGDVSQYLYRPEHIEARCADARS